MSDTVIKVNGLGKKYIISHEGTEKYKALRDVISQKTNNLLNKKQTVSVKEEFWALKNISFEIKKGEAVGIIGRNGAGKSTLLKILSRITDPTEGHIEMIGRVSSLLEVGTGFHPELTGKENIFLNGAILGMNRSEIKEKFDEIVDFSGVEKFLDTPVKRYSSGMYVRLAFAIAAHLEPEILIVDEVLAVGDAEFQKKCLGKMNEVSKQEGRTVLFVSHNMAAIQQLCSRLIYLKDGHINFEGSVGEGMKIYNQSMQIAEAKNESLTLSRNKNGNSGAFISGFNVKLSDSNKKMQICIRVEADRSIEKVEIAAGINDSLGARIITFHSRFMEQQFNLVKGSNELICSADNFFLKPGFYTMNIFIGNKYETIDYLQDPVGFEMPAYVFYPINLMPDDTQGSLLANHQWTMKTHDHACN